MDKDITVGDRVRSFDFEREESRDLDSPTVCYVEGIVMEITDPRTTSSWLLRDCPRYKISITRRVWCGDDLPVGELPEKFVYPPVNGTPTWLGGECDYVTKIREVGA